MSEEGTENKRMLVRTILTSLCVEPHKSVFVKWLCARQRNRALRTINLILDEPTEYTGE